MPGTGDAAARTTQTPPPLQTPSPGQGACCRFCARNVSELWTSRSYRDELLLIRCFKHVSACVNTFMRAGGRAVAAQRPGFHRLCSPFRATLSRVYKSHCTVVTVGTHFIYCTLGQGIKFSNEKYREVHMPFIYTHSDTQLTYCFL